MGVDMRTDHMVEEFAGHRGEGDRTIVRGEMNVSLFEDRADEGVRPIIWDFTC